MEQIFTTMRCGELPIIQHHERAPWLYNPRELDDHIKKAQGRLLLVVFSTLP